MIHVDDFVGGLVTYDDPTALIPKKEWPSSRQTIVSSGADLKDSFPYEWGFCSKCGGKGSYWESCRNQPGRAKQVNCDHGQVS